MLFKLYTNVIRNTVYYAWMKVQVRYLEARKCITFL